MSSIYNHFRKSSTFYSELRLNTLTHNLVDSWFHSYDYCTSVRKMHKNLSGMVNFQIINSNEWWDRFTVFQIWVCNKYVDFQIFWVWMKLTHLSKVFRCKWKFTMPLWFMILPCLNMNLNLQKVHEVDVSRTWWPKSKLDCYMDAFLKPNCVWCSLKLIMPSFRNMAIWNKRFRYGSPCICKVL